MFNMNPEMLPVCLSQKLQIFEFLDFYMLCHRQKSTRKQHRRAWYEELAPADTALILKLFLYKY